MELNFDLNLSQFSEDGASYVCESTIDGENNKEDVDGETEIVVNGSNTNSIEEHKNLEPCNGMEFESYEEAHSFYLEYAKVIGFGISKSSSRRSKISEEFIDVKLACTRYGKKRESNAMHPRPILKLDCKAILHVKRRHDGKWYVMNFIKDHNHDLFPNFVQYFPCHRKISNTKMHEISTLHGAGVGTSKIFTALFEKNGGYRTIGFLEKDVRNALDKERRLAIESGDAKAMLEHFMHMQEENPNFFYAIDLDEEHRLKNVLWINAKNREDYKIFGDVVSFDTTYITNKYKMPFVPFIGVNNHFQSMLLGCALLADETIPTFVWVMQTWLRAMGGKPPIAILTDQDKAMKAVIEIVFPNTRHRYCLWHIMRKIPEKLGHITKKNENFMWKFKRCIYNSWTVDEFEKRWWEIVETFELSEDRWVHSLFEEREHWVPTYMRDTFFAGMSTTQRSESINSFFDKYVNKKTILKEFVEKYMLALKDREEAEAYADFNTWHKEPILKSLSPFEKQMSLIYTHEAFKRFQLHVLGIPGCYCTKENEDGALVTFKVQEFQTKEDFRVVWDTTKSEICCSCQLFEYVGFICRHAMSSLHFSGVFEIPSQYILKRWSKDIKSKYAESHITEDDRCKEQRYNNLLEQATKLSDLGSLSHESYKIASHALEQALKKCVNGKQSSKKRKNVHCEVGKENVDANIMTTVTVLDPPIIKTKGAPKRIKSGIEHGTKRKTYTKLKNDPNTKGFENFNNLDDHSKL